MWCFIIAVIRWLPIRQTDPIDGMIIPYHGGNDNQKRRKRLFFLLHQKESAGDQTKSVNQAEFFTKSIKKRRIIVKNMEADRHFVIELTNEKAYNCYCRNRVEGFFPFRTNKVYEHLIPERTHIRRGKM